MTWTYSQPTGTPLSWPSLKDNIRYVLGDKVESDWSPSDGEVNIAIVEWNTAYADDQNDVHGVASTLAGTIMDWISVSGMESTSKSVGNSSLSKAYGNRLAGWKRLRNLLAARSPALAGRMAMSGMGLASKPPEPRQFTIGQFDNGYTPIPGDGADIPVQDQLLD